MPFALSLGLWPWPLPFALAPCPLPIALALCLGLQRVPMGVTESCAEVCLRKFVYERLSAKVGLRKFVYENLPDVPMWFVCENLSAKEKTANQNFQNRCRFHPRETTANQNAQNRCRFHPRERTANHVSESIHPRRTLPAFSPHHRDTIGPPASGQDRHRIDTVAGQKALSRARSKLHFKNLSVRTQFCTVTVQYSNRSSYTKNL